ncbi:ribonuclease HII [Garciella nitratireducens]|uniref:ribonuclease HII n=1 Tax=Garciella nitratireducens TaxID=218205 RepID=UPI000DE949B6|nr:ribonuclease HII [Garciella nitratireducens]RBP41146.1 RNase HII [Garciella nitratireducens]
MEFEKFTLLQIKKYIKSVPLEQYPQVIEELEKDQRKSVQKLVITLQRKFKIYQEELKRLDKIKYYEKKIIERGYRLIAGIDEVGRGPLAGPVVSAAVILPEDCNILYINDSKKISPHKREILYDKIKQVAIDIGIGVVDAQRIDKLNIYDATKESMYIAVNNLNKKPDFLLIDAMQCDHIPISQKSIIKGDSKSISIAAASIIAKVTRDRIMEEYHKIFPQYAFDKNKGYGTEEHCRAIKNFGISFLHRKSFLKNILKTNNNVKVE